MSTRTLAYATGMGFGLRAAPGIRSDTRFPWGPSWNQSSSVLTR